MPRGLRRLPADCVERLKRAELILHAGDLMTMDVLEELQSYGAVHAVHGNVDDREVRRALPEADVVDVGGARNATNHDAGPAKGRLRRLKRRVPQADADV